MASVIAAVNRKGGVGKTSTIYHLAGVWSQEGYRVLLVDADPQHSLTAGLLGVEAANGLHPGATIAALFDERLDPGPARLIRATPWAGLALVPGSDHLGRYNHADYAQTGPVQITLRDLVAEVGAGYDLILMDCPPNLQLLSWCALAAADWVIVPFQPEDFGCQGFATVQQAITQAQSAINPRLTLLGCLLNQVKPRTGIHRAYETVLRDVYGPQVFATMLPDAVHFKEAITERKPVSLYRPRSAAARAVRALAAEILERVAASRPAERRAA